MMGVALLYLFAMICGVWWFAGVRAHRNHPRPTGASVVPGFADRFPDSGLSWTPDDDQRVAEYLDRQQNR